MFRRQRIGRCRMLALALLVLALLRPDEAFAAPLAQNQAQLTLLPAQAMAGQAVTVRIAGVVGPAAGTTQCVGLRGPGQNFEQGISPAFNVRLGTVDISSAGRGEAVVALPNDVVAGLYSMMVGPCPPQLGIAPLTTLASAPIAVRNPIGEATQPITLSRTWFFAEGATTPPFDTWLHLFNPNANPASVVVTFLAAAPLPPIGVTIPPNRRVSFYLNQLLPPLAFGMRVDAALPIAAERAMFFRGDGTASIGANGTASTWLLAEGSTQPPFQTWLLAVNPNDAPANLTFTFFLEGGGTQQLSATIGPNSRLSLFVNLVLPNAAFATRVDADRPVVVERSMYLTTTGGGDNSIAASASQSSWYFAEGATSPPFDTWYLLFNPGSSPVHVVTQLFTDSGLGQRLDTVVPAASRQSLFLDPVAPGVAAGATITAQGGPIVAERAMYFNGGAHATIGASAPGTDWFFAEGATAPPFQTWLLLANPNNQADANVTVTFYPLTGSPVSQNVVVPSQSRVSLFVNSFLPNAAFATRVHSDQPIVAERSVYFNGGRGGTNTIGIQGQ